MQVKEKKEKRGRERTIEGGGGERKKVITREKRGRENNVRRYRFLKKENERERK